MGTINAKPFTFVPTGVSDTLDGTNAFEGAMASLSNLVPAPGNTGIFAPRPGGILLTSFPGFLNPQAVSVLGVYSGVAYGLVGTDRFPGQDEPFAYDIEADAFLPLEGVTAANCPQTLATAGEWVPPEICPITASKIVVTHVGYTGGANVLFGWFDTSSLVISSISGNLTLGSAVVTSVYDGGTSAPILDGVQPGLLITGPGIPAGATVLSATNGTFSLHTTGDTHASATLDNLGDTTAVTPGMLVSGPQFVAGTYVLTVDSISQVTLSAAALGSATGTAVDFSGGGTITMSVPATATADLQPVVISGGTPGNPLWAAGNTNGVALPAVPVAVAQYNGRAWYAVENSVVFSDSLNPLQVTNATQVLILDGKEPVTAITGQPLSNQVVGGVIQALLAFKGPDIVYQITGDQSTADLRPQAINGSVGTLAPATVVATPSGTAFISPDGLRFVGPSGFVSPTEGLRGTGVALPFIQTLTPSRMAAAYNQSTYRVSVENTSDSTTEEYWLDMSTSKWTGPHTFPASVIAPISVSSRVGFILATAVAPGSLWFSSAVPDLTSSYLENGTQMTFVFQTSLLPDNREMAMNSVIQTTQAVAIPFSTPLTYTAYDEDGNILSSIVKQLPINPALWGIGIWGVSKWVPTASNSVWGAFVWGSAPWGVKSVNFKQHSLPWDRPLVFKQASVKVTGNCVSGLALGNIYLKYRALGYVVYEDS